MTCDRGGGMQSEGGVREYGICFFGQAKDRYITKCIKIMVKNLHWCMTLVKFFNGPIGKE